MSMSNLSIDGEFRYIVQWFNEWSELQRDDFVPILVEYILQDDNGGVYMNGIENSVASANINDKPMSLFQCRMKLFRQWSPKWPQEFKHKLKEKIMEIDTKVGEKIISEIKRHNDAHSNGNTDVIASATVDADGQSVDDDIRNAAIAIVDATTEEAINVVFNNNEIIADVNDVHSVNIELAEQAEMQADEERDSVLIVVPQTVTNNAEVPLVA